MHLSKVDMYKNQWAKFNSIPFYFILACLFFVLGNYWRHYFIQPPINSDDIAYFTSFGGTYYSHFGLRILMHAIPKFAVDIFGLNINTYQYVIMFNAFILAIGLYFFSRVYSTQLVATLAVAIWAVSPIFTEVDTRVVPDNIGVGLVLIQLALIKWALTSRSELSIKKIMFILFISGILAWGAWSIRATFILASAVGMIVLFLNGARTKEYLAFIIGGLLGLIGEMLNFQYTLNDAFIRLKILTGYDNVISDAPIFQGSTLESFSSRYPNIISQFTGETIVLYLGAFGVLLWILKIIHKDNFIKLLTFIGLSFPIVFAVVSIDPLVPLMREKVRYTAVFWPLLCLACSEGLESLKVIKIAKFQHFYIVAILVFSGFYLTLNLDSLNTKKTTIRNGNNVDYAVAEAIIEHQRLHGLEKSVCVDERTSRVLSLYLTNQDGWSHCKYFDKKEIEGASYLILNWRRLNANVKRDYLAAAETHQFYSAMEYRHILLRHRRGAYYYDALVKPSENISRVASVVNSTDDVYSIYDTGRKEDAILTKADEYFMLGQNHLLYSGEDKPWRYRNDAELSGKSLFQINFKSFVASGEISPVYAYLSVWNNKKEKPERLYLGRVYVPKEEKEFSVWTYLPNDSYKSYRVSFLNKGKSKVAILPTSIGLLEKSANDEMLSLGEHW